MLNIPHGFCTAPVASFHSPKLPASAQAGSTNSPIARPCGNWGKTIRNITAGRKAKAGTMANGAPIMNARSRSFRVIESLNHRDIESFKTSGHQRRISMIQWLNTVHGLAANHRTQNFRRHDFRRETGGKIPVKELKTPEGCPPLDYSLTFLGTRETLGPVPPAVQPTTRQSVSRAV